MQLSLREANRKFFRNGSFGSNRDIFLEVFICDVEKCLFNFPTNGITVGKESLTILLGGY